jgi:small subunit ribosomal protein S24e
MEIEINEKKNNPLFNRAEVHFTVNHEGEGTPNREIIRSEIAEKLNVKKENIIIDNISSSFGIQQSRGYAKVYSNQKNAENLERKYILKRNQVIKKDIKKEDKKETIKEEGKAEPSEDEDKEIESTDKKNETEEAIKEDVVKEEKSENKSEKTDEKKE